MGVTIQDGRDTRWAAHRQQRRAQLVADALRAIRRHGAGVGMDEIAAQAGTSKTVLYRHFGDRAGLYVAVLEHVHGFIHDDLEQVLKTNGSADLAAIVHGLADAYLNLVDRDPHIYRFVITPPVQSGQVDPYGDLPELIGEHLGQLIASRVGGNDVTKAQSITWGHGIVGFVRAAADRWMAADVPEAKDTVLAHLDAFIAPALSAATPSSQADHKVVKES